MSGEFWDLKSGQWERRIDADGPHWVPISRAGGRAIHVSLSSDERLSLVLTRVHPENSLARFPADFSFDPDTGVKLRDLPIFDPQPWLPPYGAATSGVGGQQSDTRGLRQTAHSLRIEAKKPQSSSVRTPQDDADRFIPAPPPGRYEFAVGRFAADVDTLLAIELEHGSLRVWLPARQQWLPLEPSGDSFLASSGLPLEHWGAEIDLSEDTRLFLPTESGLAVVCPDVLALSYNVEYLQAGLPCWGAPMRWQNAVWVPLRDNDGTLTLLSVSAQEEAKAHRTPIPAPPQHLSEPVCGTREVIWPGLTGQLVLSKAAVGGKEQFNWLPWPDNVAPEFSFGAPYLSKTGQFWQLCRRQSDKAFVYVQMGRKAPDIHDTDSPALCSGRRSYRMNTEMRPDPWSDLPPAAYGQPSQVFYPLLESTASNPGAVLGLLLNAPNGVTALLETTDSLHAEMRLRMHDRDLGFYALKVPKPWQTSAFVFDGFLWIYHPALKRLAGIKMEASQ